MKELTTKQKIEKFGALFTCPKCFGDIYGKGNIKTHNCNVSLAERGLVFADEKRKSVRSMTDEEKAIAEKNPVKQEVKTEPEDLTAQNAFEKVCASVVKQSETIKNEKELTALSERFVKSESEYKLAYPERKEHPEFVQACVDALIALQAKFKK